MQNKYSILKRFFIFYVLFGVFALWIIVRTLFMWFSEGDELRKRADNIIERKCTFSAIRGGIYAQDGRFLSVSIPEYVVRMDFRADGLKQKVFDANVDSLAICLADLFKDKTTRQYRSFLIAKKRKKEGNRYVRLGNRNIDYNELKALKKFPLFRLGKNKSGLIAELKDERIQPHGDLAHRTIGRLKLREGIDEKRVGAIGMEEAYESELQSTEGKGVMRKVPGGFVPVKLTEPKDGNDVISTIDINYQDVAESALRNQLEEYEADHGSVVLMEVKTGAIKAIANLGLNKKKDKYVEGYNYAIGEPTEPGSTFKLASIMALLEDGYVEPTDTIDTGNGVCSFYNKRMRDSHHGGYGRITVQQVMEKSSNVGVSKMVNQYYKGKPEDFIDRLYSFHLNEKLGVDITGEGTPYIKYPKNNKHWYGTSLPWMSVGYETKLTPLQVLSLYNTIANNGEMVKPRLVDEVRYHGRVLKKYETEILHSRICSKKTLRIVRKMLEGVVLRGTARNLRNNNYSIAGKTGTAQISRGRSGYRNAQGGRDYQASFAGYFPADNPLYSCIVVINKPNNRRGFYGNQVAGPVFKTIADKVYAMSYQMHPTKVETAKNDIIPISANGSRNDLTTVFNAISVGINNPNINSEWVLTARTADAVNYRNRNVNGRSIPNVKGMCVQDAIYVLENIGLKVNVRGIGTVKKQSIQPGKAFKRGTRITIELS